MVGAEDPDAPVPEIVGGKEFLIPLAGAGTQKDEVDQSLPATRRAWRAISF